MIRTKGRRRLTCYHEAGHCLARWFFGFASDSVWALTVAQVRAGEFPRDSRDRICEAEGMVERFDIVSPTLSQALLDKMAGDPEWIARARQEMPACAEIEMLESFCCPVAEAQYRKVSLVVTLLQGGEMDFEHIKRVNAAWFADDNHAANTLAEQRAVALVRSPKGWAAITAIADALYERGRLESEEIDALCAKAYGRPMMDFYGWRVHWPPSMKQIRTGNYPPAPMLNLDEGSRAAELALQ